MTKPKPKLVRPLIIQERLRSGKHFLELAQDYDLEIQQHPFHKHLIWFGMGSGDPTEPLVQQCRGLILDSTDNWNVAARPLDHIFEWDAPGAPKLDGKIKTFDKVDGIMVYMFYYDGWYLGSKKNSDASDTIPGGGTLSNIFWSTFEDTAGYRLPPKWAEIHTFIWELTGPELSPVVVDASGLRRLSLIAVRNNLTGEELDPETFADQQIRPYACPWEDTIDTYKGIKHTLETVVSTALPFTEGVVLRDENFKRLIVTHPEYETARNLRKQLSVAWLVNNVRSRHPLSHDTLVSYGADNWLDLHHLISMGYADLVRRIVDARSSLADIATRDAYVVAASLYDFDDILVALYDKKYVHAVDALRALPYDELLAMMEIIPTERKTA